MTLYRIDPNKLVELSNVSLADSGIRERQDLQRLLREQIDVILPDTMVIAEEYSEWQDSKRRIDLLCLDRQANLIVVELKRTNDGGHMDLQAIRYAAMVAPMTFDRLIDAHRNYLAQTDRSTIDTQQNILEFLQWDEPNEDTFANDVRIVLVSADFSTEITTAVLWLNERNLDIRCIKLSPHQLDNKIILNVEQCIPLPEAQAYQVQQREKSNQQRQARRQQQEWTGYWFMNVGDEGGKHPHRSWEDCRKYGFMLAGGNEGWFDRIQRLTPGALFYAYISGSGFVGYGKVTAPAVPMKDFKTGDGKNLTDQPLSKPPDFENLNDPVVCDYCVEVEWYKTLDREEAVLQQYGLRESPCRIRMAEMAEQLHQVFAE